jgi:hypothetical protein
MAERLRRQHVATAYITKQIFTPTSALGQCFAEKLDSQTRERHHMRSAVLAPLGRNQPDTLPVKVEFGFGHASDLAWPLSRHKD